MPAMSSSRSQPQSPAAATNALDVRPMTESDVADVVALADRVVGPGYWTAAEVRETLERSRKGKRVCSHVVRDADGSLLGFRFALPPGRWEHGRGRGLCPERWPFARETAGYFQSAWVAPEARGRGVGPAMAARALHDLRAAGAAGVVTHSWKESPNDSSQRYLRRLGFEAVAEHVDYWAEVDYVCSRDGNPCRCTAIEMVLSLD
ncbi:MAG: hypothetical protein RIT45_1453 [Pseudomonadota bacterium]|jgi:ribosomal protein S18 acetylase RimI-like enzyme